MLTNSNKRIATMFLLVLVSCIATIIMSKQIFPVDEAVDMNGGMIAFYMLFDGNRILLYFLITVVAVSSLLMPVYFQEIAANKFNRLIMIRVGYKGYIKLLVLECFKSGVIFYAFVQIFAYVLMNFINMRIDIFGVGLTHYAVFSDSNFVNLLCFIIFGSIGYGVYSVFLAVIAQFLKNKYVYSVSSLIVFFASFIIFFIFAGVFQTALGVYEGSLTFTILQSVLCLNLFTPAFFSYGNGFLCFALTALFYGSLSAFLILKYRREIITND